MDIVGMPQLGETVTEGTITRWSKAVGEAVALDDALFEVSTEKVDTEVPAAVAGFLRAILVEEGDTVPVGTPVAVITPTADEAVEFDDVPRAARLPTGTGEALPVSDRTGPDTPAETPRPASGRTGRTGEVRSPAVRRLLDEHGLDPSDVAGSGRDGRITRADVLAAVAQGARVPASPTPAAAASPTPPPAQPIVVGALDEVLELSRSRLTTAEHLSRSLTTAAHALVAVEVDYVDVERVRRAAGLSYLPFVARAVIDAIAEFPHVNASFDTDRLVIRRRVHLGVAVDVAQEALVVPVVHDADGLRLRALSEAVSDLADRARRRRLPADALAGGTFTLTNVGSYGTLVTTPIINQPEVAILSTDGVRMAPVAVRTDGGSVGEERTWGLAVHPVGNLSLSFDHRAFDGAYAAAFLARVREILQTRDWSYEVGS